MDTFKYFFLDFFFFFPEKILKEEAFIVVALKHDS